MGVGGGDERSTVVWDGCETLLTTCSLAMLNTLPEYLKYSARAFEWKVTVDAN